MEKKYSINIIHFVNEDTKENSIDENFYKNNNISYVSIINKKSKSVFNFDIKPNKYKIIKESKNINQIIIELIKILEKKVIVIVEMKMKRILVGFALILIWMKIIH